MVVPAVGSSPARSGSSVDADAASSSRFPAHAGTGAPTASSIRYASHDLTVGHASGAPSSCDACSTSNSTTTASQLSMTYWASSGARR
ncbi:MAG TPA: hypothetical protein VM345_18810 [Acidimicrobiales bacterium]|nr:hypothetical protein [Acidimicrobiales bacterium]